MSVVRPILRLKNSDRDGAIGGLSDFSFPNRVSTVNRPLASRAELLIGALVVGLCAVGSNAQGPAGRNLGSESTLARFVSPDAGFFVEFDRLAVGGSSGKALQAFRLYELLVGEQARGDADDGDVRQSLLRSLGVPAGGDARDLFRHRIAVAAPSWERLSDGVMIIAMEGDTNLINNVFEPISPGSIDGDDNVTVYTSKTFLAVATDGKVLVVGRRRHRQGLYRHAVRLMQGKSTESLATRSAFRETVQELPRGRDGTVFVDFLVNKGFSTVFPAAADYGSAGIYFSDDRVDVAFRAHRRKVENNKSSSISFARVADLPQTTLAVWTAEIDPVEIVRKALGVDSPGDGGRYLEGMAEIFDVDAVTERVLGKLGSQAVIAWDQNLGEGPDVPQIAIMFDAPDASACVALLANTVQVVVDWFDLKHRQEGGPRFQLQSSEYLGVRVHELTIPGVAGPLAGHGDDTFKPAFAAVGRTFVLAVGADHIRNILDARLGLAPQIGELDALRSRKTNPPTASSRAVAQPAMIARTLGNWLADGDSVLSRWLANGRSRGNGDGERFRLGIGVADGKSPGAVRVVRVDGQGRASGRLRPGDEILGLNDHFLPLEDSRGALRRLMTDARRVNRWTFRVRRGPRLIDVVVPTGSPIPVTQSFGDPVGALRQLQSMLARVDFVGIHLVEASPTQLQAHVSVRFADIPETR